MRGVVGAVGEIHEPGLFGIDLVVVADELDSIVGQVLREVVSLFRRVRRIDRVIVVNQVGIPVVGLATEESVVALKAASGRPSAARRCHV